MRSDWFDSLFASSPEWSDRRVVLEVGSYASSDNLVLVEGRLERVERVPADERRSDSREAMLFLRADETVVLTLVEDTVEPGSSIGSTGFQATLAGVTADLSVLSEQAGPDLDGWSADQGAQALRLMTEVPWADIENALFDLELCLDRAIEATEPFAGLWDGVLDATGSSDEFSLRTDAVEALTPRQLLAYLGQLMRTARAAAGLGGDGSSRGGSPVAVLQDLVLTDRDLQVD